MNVVSTSKHNVETTSDFNVEITPDFKVEATSVLMNTNVFSTLKFDVVSACICLLGIICVLLTLEVMNVGLDPLRGFLVGHSYFRRLRENVRILIITELTLDVDIYGVQIHVRVGLRVTTLANSDLLNLT